MNCAGSYEFCGSHVGENIGSINSAAATKTSIKTKMKKKTDKYRKNQKHCERKLKEDECLGTMLSAISTLVEDAPEITLLLYFILRGEEQDILG